MWSNYSNVQKIVLILVATPSFALVVGAIITRDPSPIAVVAVFLGMPWSLLFSYITSLLSDIGWHPVTMTCFGMLGAYINWRLLIQSSFAQKETSQTQKLPEQALPDIEQKAKYYLYRSLILQYSILIMLVLAVVSDTLLGSDVVLNTAVLLLGGIGFVWFVGVIQSITTYTGHMWKYWHVLPQKAKICFWAYCAQFALFAYAFVALLLN